MKTVVVLMTLVVVDAVASVLPPCVGGFFTYTAEYTNSDGTESQRTITDSIYGSVTPGHDGVLDAVTITASGATDNSGFIQLIVGHSFSDLSSTPYRSEPQYQFTTYAVRDLSLTDSAHFATYNTPWQVTAGSPIWIDWTTLGPSRHAQVLATSGGAIVFTAHVSWKVPCVCPARAAPDHGTASSTSVASYQDTVTFGCDAPYTLDGSAVSTCALQPDGSTAWSSDVPLCTSSSGCVSICDDPHFLGLNGVRYNFQGEPDKTFALVSEEDVQLNSQFISHVWNGEQRTNLGPTCIRTCSENVTMLPNGELHVNDKRLYWHDEVDQRSHDFRGVNVTYLAKRTIEVTVPGRWRFELHANGAYINVNRAVPLAPEGDAARNHQRDVHGVFGHTLGAPVRREHQKCNTYQQGGCAVEGAFKDYEVDGDLCSAEWSHRRFAC